MLNLRKLFTHEDPFFLHKIFGGLALLNFIYRFICVYFNSSMFLDNNLGKYSLAIHGLLSISSLFFRISNFRNKNAPMIYPEMRLHSIIFAWRSIICCYLTFFSFDTTIIRIFICFFTMLAADTVSHYVKDGTTIRNMSYDTNKMNENDHSRLVYHYARSQVGATNFMLGTSETCFAPLIAIQLAALLMTLVRKNIIKGHMFHVGYSIALWINVLSYFSSTPGWVVLHFINNNIFSTLRFNYNWNKYLSWMITFLLYLLLKDFGFDNYIDSFFTSDLSIRFMHILTFIYIIKNVITHSSLFM